MRQHSRFGAILGLIPAVAVWSAAPVLADDQPPAAIAEFFHPPAEFAEDVGSYKDLLKFDDGRPVTNEADWRERRREIKEYWLGQIGAPPPLIERPKVEVLGEERLDGYARRKVRVEVASDRTTSGYVLIPDGEGPFPAMLVVFYEPETAVGMGERSERDFARQLVGQGFACLSIGFDPRVIDTGKSDIKIQPLSYLAYVASNALTTMREFPEVDAQRIGVMGHSYGGKWAMFAACLDERFACGVWSDPGIVFDETRRDVNYWEPWYLGWEPDRTREPGLVTADNPRTGPYAQLIADGRDLHELQALMAPRPFLVSGGAEDQPKSWRALNRIVAVYDLLGRENRVAMTNRELHAPNPESNRQIVQFLNYVLKPADVDR